MPVEIAVDAAYPPAPTDWVADIKSIGATAAFFYAVGPLANYSRDHITEAERNGIVTVPIIVPGNNPMDAQRQIQAVRVFGSSSHLIAYDTELNSEPPLAWLLGAFTVARAMGYSPGLYGDQAHLDRYSPAGPDWRWLAAWVMTGKYQPVPMLTPGDPVHQYANDVPIGSAMYDVSVYDPALITLSDQRRKSLCYSSEGSMVILSHPISNTRLDVLWTDQTGMVNHVFTEGGAGGIDSGATHADYGSPAEGPIEPGTLAAAWDGQSRLLIIGATPTGNMYLKVVNLDGTYAQDWSQFPGTSALPGVDSSALGDAHIREIVKEEINAARIVEP